MKFIDKRGIFMFSAPRKEVSIMQTNEEVTITVEKGDGVGPGGVGSDQPETGTREDERPEMPDEGETDRTQGGAAGGTITFVTEPLASDPSPSRAQPSVSPISFVYSLLGQANVRLHSQHGNYLTVSQKIGAALESRVIMTPGEIGMALAIALAGLDSQITVGEIEQMLPRTLSDPTQVEAAFFRAFNRFEYGDFEPPCDDAWWKSRSLRAVATRHYFEGLVGEIVSIVQFRGDWQKRGPDYALTQALTRRFGPSAHIMKTLDVDGAGGVSWGILEENAAFRAKGRPLDVASTIALVSACGSFATNPQSMDFVAYVLYCLNVVPGSEREGTSVAWIKLLDMLFSSET